MATACRAQPHDQNQGIIRPCPLRDTCKRYTRYANTRKGRVIVDLIQGPYDFEDEECGKYERSK